MADREIRDRRCYTDRVKRKAEHVPDISKGRVGFSRSETLVRKSNMRQTHKAAATACSVLRVLLFTQRLLTTYINTTYQGKSFTIHPEVTHYRYKQNIPR